MQLDAISIAYNELDRRTYCKVELVQPQLGRCYLIWATLPGNGHNPIPCQYWETYSSQQLNVARTRSRVIYRILKAIMPSLEPMASLPNGDYYRSFRLSDKTQQFETDNCTRFFASRTSDESLRHRVLDAIERSRSYGSRPARLTKLRAVPAKPLKFKELWRRDYHDYSIADCPSEEGNFSSNGNFRMGVELEAMTRGKIWGDDTYMYRSEDGSIGNGSEFVTRPDSAAVHVKELGTFLDHNRISPDPRCGMHVHVDRRMVQPQAVNHIVDRMFDRRRRNFYVKYVAGREPNSYCSLKRDQLGSKYCALNTGRGLTIEFRWFSSTNKIHVIKRRLQWINAICAWAVRKSGVIPEAPILPEISIRERARARIISRYGDGACFCDSCMESTMDQIMQTETF